MQYSENAESMNNERNPLIVYSPDEIRHNFLVAKIRQVDAASNNSMRNELKEKISKDKKDLFLLRFCTEMAWWVMFSPSEFSSFAIRSGRMINYGRNDCLSFVSSGNILTRQVLFLQYVSWAHDVLWWLFTRKPRQSYCLRCYTYMKISNECTLIKENTLYFLFLILNENNV